MRQFLWKGRRSRVSLERVTQSRAKGGLGLLPAGLQSQCLLAKWFGRVYGQDAPGWCALGRAQLQRHLVAAGLSPHALLAPEKRKCVNRLPEPWRSRVKAWYALDGGCPSDLSTLSLETVLPLPIECAVSRVDSKPVKPTRKWQQQGVSFIGDLYELAADGNGYFLKNRDSTIHERVAKNIRQEHWRLNSQVHDTLSRAMRQVTPDPEARLSLVASLGGKNLDGYAVKDARLDQRKKTQVALSALMSNEEPKPIWRRVFCLALMPKLQSFLWNCTAKRPTMASG
ncbi:hypothetical protein THASP1DRAFT_27580 [Thamnocephalis sphaerospora]|uniref:Uncharacterized protein n=1 Tax=Thamnocephalis sphaerospora TaxID=78915 RepID=A0A4P9XX80_9FUNG|nr:hypothetical protein THASP1DRAFT_27580 [Thamnocephalis sphaerospora]|eukprot:RKP10612.1 hypothetical protein THASP1DRAFT_27580 [Thamnocephalis sphaerospora]